MEIGFGVVVLAAKDEKPLVHHRGRMVPTLLRDAPRDHWSAPSHPLSVEDVQVVQVDGPVFHVEARAAEDDDLRANHGRCVPLALARRLARAHAD